ncbi:MAG: hypothetical protein LC792_26760 [Actinobacteria bacterium]|nr:hypothetical protein [Actinomycetota bacterium]
MQAQPVRTAPGQEYGKATAQAEAQRVVPMAAAPPIPAGGGGGPVFAPSPGFDQSIPVPAGYIAPGEVTPLHAPTERPGEPLTHGLPVGPGAGPEALGATLQQGTLGALLRQAATTSGASPEVRALAQWVSGQPR